MAYYSVHPALHPSDQLKLFKIVPDDFVSSNSKHRVDVTPAKRGKGRMKKGALPRPQELQPATRASPGSDWFA
jgi:hypothetical protein